MQSKKIAVTGGIGSGKSTVCKIIKEAGYTVLSCDKIYSELLKENAFIEKLKNAFPQAIVGGQLNRRALAKAVFADGEMLKKLDSIAFPAIMERAHKMLENLEIGFVEVPLLFEGGFEKDFDEVWVLTRNKENILAAVTERSNLTREEVVARINSQFDYDGADLSNCKVIENDGILSDLREKINKALKDI